MDKVYLGILVTILIQFIGFVYLYGKQTQKLTNHEKEHDRHRMQFKEHGQQINDHGKQLAKHEGQLTGLSK